MVGVAANHKRLVDAVEHRLEARDGGDRGDDLVVAARRAVAVQRAVERHERLEAVEQVAVGARDAPGRERIRARRRVVGGVDACVGIAAVEEVDDLAVGVAAHPAHRQSEPAQAIEHLGGHRPGGDVAADDDGLGAGEGRIGEHGLERRQVAVHVVERGDDRHAAGPDGAGGACC